MERDKGLGDDHGPSKLAIPFLGADGYASYDALYCQGENRAPYCVVIQDHGFGGDYGNSSFGRGGSLEQLAQHHGQQMFPYLFVGN